LRESRGIVGDPKPAKDAALARRIVGELDGDRVARVPTFGACVLDGKSRNGVESRFLFRVMRT
jgi:hypothetical protein